MIFRTEGTFVYYFFNGDFPVLVHLPEDTNPNAYYWTGIPAGDTNPQEIAALNELAGSKKRIFQLETRPKQRFVIEARGVFLEE